MSWHIWATEKVVPVGIPEDVLRTVDGMPELAFEERISRADMEPLLRR